MRFLIALCVLLATMLPSVGLAADLCLTQVWFESGYGDPLAGYEACDCESYNEKIYTIYQVEERRELSNGMTGWLVIGHMSEFKTIDPEGNEHIVLNWNIKEKVGSREEVTDAGGACDIAIDAAREFTGNTKIKVKFRCQ